MCHKKIFREILRVILISPYPWRQEVQTTNFSSIPSDDRHGIKVPGYFFRWYGVAVRRYASRRAAASVSVSQKSKVILYFIFFASYVVYFAFYGLFIPCPLFYTPKALKGFQRAFFVVWSCASFLCHFTGFFLPAFSFLPLPRFGGFYGLIWCRVRHGWRRLLFLSAEVVRPSLLFLCGCLRNPPRFRAVESPGCFAHTLRPLLGCSLKTFSFARFRLFSPCGLYSTKGGFLCRFWAYNRL